MTAVVAFGGDEVRAATFVHTVRQAQQRHNAEQQPKSNEHCDTVELHINNSICLLALLRKSYP